jgi:CubicO group peptidase (beta-lactamase class C family)
VFDLASLTKVIATASFAMRCVSDGVLDLEAPVGRYLREWTDHRHRDIRIRHLLDHSSGMPAHARLWEQARGREAYEHALHALTPAARPTEAAVYSDLGFILLGFVLADVAARPLDEQLSALTSTFDEGLLTFLPPDAWRSRIAPTEFDPWRNRLLVGEVHDENAAALSGIAGHAGLFGTTGGVGGFARLVLRTFAHGSSLGPASLIREFATRSAVTGSSRALGWDTMLPTSSCGSRLSSSAVGHTGFTGTSLWIDHERDLYVVFLTNRVYPSRSNDAIRGIRPRVHDAVIEDLERPA